MCGRGCEICQVKFPATCCVKIDIIIYGYPVACRGVVHFLINVIFIKIDLIPSNPVFPGPDRIHSVSIFNYNPAIILEEAIDTESHQGGPTFHYSSTPWHSIAVRLRRIISDLALRAGGPEDQVFNVRIKFSAFLNTIISISYGKRIKMLRI
jgi:hypothetical protein